ncbi:MAG: hypothetical protein V1738_03575 [Patescibacteria group bacterium]
MSSKQSDDQKSICIDASSSAGQMQQALNSVKTSNETLVQLLNGAQAEDVRGALQATMIANDELLSHLPLIKEFLDHIGVKRVSDLDAAGRTALITHMENLWSIHVQPLLDKPSN